MHTKDDGKRLNAANKIGRSLLLYPQEHSNIIEIFNLLTMFIGIPVFIIFGCSAMSSKNFIPLFVMIAVLIILDFVIWGLPVRCKDQSCPGRVEKHRERLDSFHMKLNYRCWLCYSFYEKIIFTLPPGDYNP